VKSKTEGSDVECKDAEVKKSGECIFMPEANSECVLLKCAFEDSQESEQPGSYEPE
jgi:hypothetical protein